MYAADVTSRQHFQAIRIFCRLRVDVSHEKKYIQNSEPVKTQASLSSYRDVSKFVRIKYCNYTFYLFTCSFVVC